MPIKLDLLFLIIAHRATLFAPTSKFHYWLLFIK